jgi:hypothetical protein
VRAIRRISIFILLLAFLVSTNGIAIYHHICGCGVYKPNLSAVVTESEPGSCCCSLPHESACCEEDDHLVCASNDHKGCRNEVIYLKAEIVATPPSIKIPNIIPSEIILDNFWISAVLPDLERHSVIPVRIESQPLPPATPVYLLIHHIRIPLPEDHC